MTFVNETMVVTEDGAIYTKCECTVCGSKWVRTTSNTPQQDCCVSVYSITEWDGTTIMVHVDVDQEGEEMVLTYQDGVTHKVTQEYFHEALKGRRVYR